MGFFDKFKGKQPPLKEVAANEPPAAPEEPKDLARLKDGLLVLHWAALADGVQQEEEYDVIRDYAQERIAAAGPKGADVGALIVWLRPLKPTEQEVREAIGRIVDGTDHGQLVRRYAQTLIKSDDSVDIGEMKAMQLMSKFFAEAEAVKG